MSNILYIHPDNPQPRLLSRAIEVIINQGVIVIPTDSGYALSTKIDNKKGQNRMADIRQLEKGHFFSLICADLSEIAHFSRVDNSQYRLLKAATPGAFTFILKASQELPKRIFGDKRKTIGIRVPNIKVVKSLLAELGEPLLTTTLILPEEEISQMYVEDIYDRITHQVDLVVDAGGVSFEPTTVVDLSEGMPPKIIRQGQGNTSVFM